MLRRMAGVSSSCRRRPCARDRGLVGGRARRGHLHTTQAALAVALPRHRDLVATVAVGKVPASFVSLRRSVPNFTNFVSILYQPRSQIYLQLDCFPSRHTQNINLPRNLTGCEESESMYKKLLARRIQICRVQFCIIYVDLFFQNNFPNRVPTKMNPEDLFLLGRTL